MGAFAGAIKNAALTTAANEAKFVGLASDVRKAMTSNSAVGSTINLTANGYSNDDIIIPTGLTGGAGLVVGRPYHVVEVAANTFKLAFTKGGAAVSFTTELTAATFAKLTELSGGTYKPIACAFPAPTNGVTEDTTNRVISVPAAGKPHWIVYRNLETGTLQEKIVAVNEVTEETFVEAGTYTVEKGKLEDTVVA